MLERRQIGLDVPPALHGGPAGAGAASIAEHFAWIGREKGVARPPLAPFERFEQEAVGAAMQLGERRDGGVAVEDHLAGHGDHRAALARTRGEGIERGGHWGAATR